MEIEKLVHQVMLLHFVEQDTIVPPGDGEALNWALSLFLPLTRLALFHFGRVFADCLL